MLSGDGVASAAMQAGIWRDKRVRQWWDGAKEMSELAKRSLGLQGPAWDVYLLYRAGIRWEAEGPPVPSFWMHQLSDPAADPALYLARDPSRLASEMENLLEE